MTKKLFKFDMKIEAVDSITGFCGTITARCEYLTGCRQYVLTPKCKHDGAYIDGQWFDEDRLLQQIPKKPKNTGGPQSNPPPAK